MEAYALIMLPSQGTLTSTSQETICRIESAKAKVGMIRLRNQGTSTATVSLYLNTGGAAICFHRSTLAGGQEYSMDGVMDLESNDLILGQASIANAINYFVTGEEIKV